MIADGEEGQVIYDHSLVSNLYSRCASYQKIHLGMIVNWLESKSQKDQC